MRRTAHHMIRVRQSIVYLCHRSNFALLPILGNYQGQDVHSPDDCSRHPDQTVEIAHEEQKKKWWDLDDKRKKELEVQRSLSQV